VGNTFGFCPGTDAVGDLVGNAAVYLFAATDTGDQAFIRFIT
jgi:hypothetical protein